MYRELHEEVGLDEGDVEVLGVTSDWLRYRLPDKYLRRNSKPLCIGQKQRWFMLRLVSERRPDLHRSLRQAGIRSHSLGAVLAAR